MAAPTQDVQTRVRRGPAMVLNMSAAKENAGQRINALRRYIALSRDEPPPSTAVSRATAPPKRKGAAELTATP